MRVDQLFGFNSGDIILGLLKYKVVSPSIAHKLLFFITKYLIQIIHDVAFNPIFNNLFLKLIFSRKQRK